tara:strand:+ start:247 stop:1401 length:1155 start_codon:yes stop_codon:yes gene_type:complete
MLVSQISLAEMKLIDDEALSKISGKGLTIDIDMGLEIGEFMFKDAGSIVVQGMRLGGMDHTNAVGTSYDASVGIVADPNPNGDPGKGNSVGFETAYGGTTGLNNVRIEVDVAGAGEVFDLAWRDLTSNALCSHCQYTANDGDLIISATASDARISAIAGPEAGSSTTVADFGLEIDKFAIKASSYVAGDDIVDRSGTSTTAQSTTLMSNIRMEGYLAGFDLIVENKGNGFGEYDSLGNFTETGVGSAASKIKINSFFKITEMEYDFDIIGVRYEGIKIHNQRGSQLIKFDLNQDDATGYVSRSETMAQAGTHIFSVKDVVLNLSTLSAPTGNNPNGYVDGVAMNTRFSGDIDIAHLSFGDTGTSIGAQYWTDIAATTNMVISAR